jgi:hypothetical protein
MNALPGQKRVIFEEAITASVAVELDLSRHRGMMLGVILANLGVAQTVAPTVQVWNGATWTTLASATPLATPGIHVVHFGPAVTTTTGVDESILAVLPARTKLAMVLANGTLADVIVELIPTAE